MQVSVDGQIMRPHGNHDTARIRRMAFIACASVLEQWIAYRGDRAFENLL